MSADPAPFLPGWLFIDDRGNDRVGRFGDGAEAWMKTGMTQRLLAGASGIV
jgi:hypothetical protein